MANSPAPIPRREASGGYGDLYRNTLAGFIARAEYGLGLALAIGTEMVGAATYMAAWFPSVRGYWWIIITVGRVLVINLRSVGASGRFEFWLSMITLATITAFILIGASLLASGRSLRNTAPAVGSSQRPWGRPPE